MPNLIFRRINGRIIPIRREENNLAKGAALIGGGLGAAATAGGVAASLVRDAAHAENTARKTVKAARSAFKAAQNTGPLFEAGAGKEYIRAGHEALRTMATSRETFKAAMNVKNFGFVVGSGLVGAGVNQILKETRFKEDTKTRAAVATGAAVATHFAVRSSFLKGIGPASLRFSDALRTAAKHVVKKRFGG